MDKLKIVKVDHVDDTRNKNNMYYLPRTSKTIDCRTFKYLAPRIYKILPAEVKQHQKYYCYKIVLHC